MPLTKSQLRHAKRTFRSFSGADLLIDYPEWKRAVGIKNDFLLRRIFELVDTDGSGFIDRDEFIAFVTSLFSDRRQRLEFIFRVYDLDGDGAIDPQEVRQVLDASLSEQQVRLGEPIVAGLVGDFMRLMDTDKDNSISLEEFVQVASHYPGIDEQFAVHAANWLRYGRELKLPRIAPAAFRLRMRRWWQSYRKPFGWTVFYLSGNAAIFFFAMQKYADSGESLAVQIARGAGACLDLNTALVLVPVCKSFWSWLRQTPIARVFPLADTVRLHRVLAESLAIFSLVHVAAHLVNYRDTAQAVAEVLTTTVVGITGVVATAVLFVMLWAGMAPKKRRYEIFAASHLLYAVFIAALLLHTPKVIPWLAPPLIFFFFESLVRAFHKTSTIDSVRLTPLANGVTKVTLKKPKGFAFYPGDYLRLQMPDLSKHQWHPFTISAAPEAEELSVYVRNNGDWTGALHNLSCKKSSKGKFWQARIDGPYATPSSTVYRARVAVLIAAGIGVTPYASLLQSVILRKETAGSRKFEQTIYFHWLNRSQRSYEWFIELLAEAERALGRARLRLHIHLTSLTHDLTNIAMQIAMDAYRERSERDPITGLFVNTSAGRPNWDAIFKETAAAHPRDQVDVFFCGPPALGAVVKKNCRKHGFLFHDEKF